MPHPESKPPRRAARPRRQVTTLAELVRALQDAGQDDRQVVATLSELMQKGHLRRLVSLGRAA